MKEIYSTIIQFRGTHYNFGYLQGKQLKDSLIVRNREKQWKVRKPRFTVNEPFAEEIITSYAPGLWSELLGLRDALSWPMKRVLKEFGGYRSNYNRSGCSVLTGKDYLIRNYDFHPKTYEGRYVFFQPTDKGYATIGPSQRITGRPDGMNEKGLSVGYNFMHRKNPGDGFICGVIARILLETCANVEEAIHLLKDIPHRHSFSYIILDKIGITYVIEASPLGVVVRESNVCTNHFEVKTEENRRYLLDSYKRMNVMKEKHDNLKTAHDAFRLLNDTDKGVFSKEYKNWAGTIHTSAYLPKQLEAWFVLGGDQEPIKFDFEDWIKGNDIKLEKINGIIDTNLPFVHMDANAHWFGRNED